MSKPSAEPVKLDNTKTLPDYPRFHLRKEVAAFKIEEVTPQPDGTVKLSGSGYEASVGDEWVQRSLPNVGPGVASFIGGYFVVFEPYNLAAWFHGEHFENEYSPEA